MVEFGFGQSPTFFCRIMSYFSRIRRVCQGL
nr:MAG TPA: hypothetical protein [Bacteriophage sp.]